MLYSSGNASIFMESTLMCVWHLCQNPIHKSLNINPSFEALFTAQKCSRLLLLAVPLRHEYFFLTAEKGEAYLEIRQCVYLSSPSNKLMLSEVHHTVDESETRRRRKSIA